MGYIVPAYSEIRRKPGKKWVVVDSTPLNKWFEVLPSSEIQIIDQAKAIKLSYLSRMTHFARGYRVEPLIGWDKSTLFNTRNLRQIAEQMNEDLRTRFDEQVTQETPRIVVFGREFTPDHYAEKLPTRYGVAKRNIPNLSEVVGELSKTIDIQLVDPAELTVAETFVLCHRADVVIGQHGAALTNMFFMRPGTQVIEIGWPDLTSDIELPMYRLMARELGIKWSRPILQEHNFGPITASDLANEIAVQRP